MKTLLKDMPEHMERMEANYETISAIKDILDEHSDYSETRGEYVIGEDDFTKISTLINEKLTEFVNQNYEWKGLKS